ncbi:sugar phosphate nucleotidyltransferase [Streptomyces sp. NPDC050481]|uniref:sugar phosphate nucleotidyltransferase n=1 Tax=Streptomyces sp. NPDC050481 TaxID=3365616 RepID=UPI0037B4D20A
MKALVLSGGAGTRSRPITHASAEQLVPVADKAVPFHGLERLADARITQAGMTVGDTAARDRLGADGFVTRLGGNLDVGGITDLVDEFRGSRPDARIPLTQVSDPRAFGVAEFGPDGQAVGLEEEPVTQASFQHLVVEEGARVIDSRIVGPAVIGSGTEMLGDRSKVRVRS